jgi:hypothetical protein
MDKAICCDTKRHLDKDQVPEAVHAGLPSKPANLKPEQTPDLKDVLNSDMYAKSKKTPLKKEATEKKAAEESAEKAEDKPAVKSDKPADKPKPAVKSDKPADEPKPAEKSEEVKAERSEEKAKDLKEDAKKKSEKATEDLKKAEKEEKKSEPEKESTTFDFEGIELSAGMEDVELTAEEAAKLSKLF